jgi:hypothetical protein
MQSTSSPTKLQDHYSDGLLSGWNSNAEGSERPQCNTHHCNDVSKIYEYRKYESCIGMSAHVQQ